MFSESVHSHCCSCAAESGKRSLLSGSRTWECHSCDTGFAGMKDSRLRGLMESWLQRTIEVRCRTQDSGDTRVMKYLLRKAKSLQIRVKREAKCIPGGTAGQVELLKALGAQEILSWATDGHHIAAEFDVCCVGVWSCFGLIIPSFVLIFSFGIGMFTLGLNTEHPPYDLMFEYWNYWGKLWNFWGVDPWEGKCVSKGRLWSLVAWLLLVSGLWMESFLTTKGWNWKSARETKLETHKYMEVKYKFKQPPGQRRNHKKI